MVKKLFVAITSLLICFFSAGVVHAQTVLDFPRVISSPDIFTGIAIGNPTSQSVAVTYTAFLPDGTRLAGSGINNPVTVTLGAGSQYARLFGEIFGNVTDFNGWVEATSPTSGLTGFSLNGRLSGGDFDGTVAVKPTTQLWLPFVSEVGPAKRKLRSSTLTTKLLTSK